MYSGTTLRPLTGRMVGAHQKIDRLARTSIVKLLLDNNSFPPAKLILHFEGVNGPDSIKRKSPAKDEPWHFYTPFDDKDKRLIKFLDLHYDQLVAALKKHDQVRAAFEAAWLAHAIVDGLTPAHHYPYEEKLSELRGGKSSATRNTLKNKLILPGATPGQKLKNNWKMWGPKGLINMHGTFEWGVAVMLIPMRGKQAVLSKEDIAELHEYGVLKLFRRRAKEIAVLGVYDQYEQRGWTPALARVVRRQVVPRIISMVTLAWYAAAIDAGLVKEQ